MSNIYKVITIHLGRQKKKNSTIKFLMNICDTRISLNESFDRFFIRPRVPLYIWLIHLEILDLIPPAY